MWSRRILHSLVKTLLKCNDDWSLSKQMSREVWKCPHDCIYRVHRERERDPSLRLEIYYYCNFYDYIYEIMMDFKTNLYKNFNAPLSFFISLHQLISFHSWCSSDYNRGQQYFHHSPLHLMCRSKRMNFASAKREMLRREERNFN
jgi:hypothetical protein